MSNSSDWTPSPAPEDTIHYIHYQLPTSSIPPLIFWSLLTAVVSLAGNSVILIGTIKHNAIKLDQLSLVLIKNLAVSDIFNTLFTVLPGVVTLYTGRALFEDNIIFCAILSYVQFIFPIFNSLIICALTLNKLLILLKPLRAMSSGERDHVIGYSLVGAAWICGGVPGIEYLIIGERTITFDTRICR